MKKVFSLLLSLTMVMALLAGCGGAPASGSGAGTSSGGYELALVTDIGTIDDKSFNQGSWEGLVKYAEEKGISHQYYKPTEKSTDAYLSAIDLAVKGGAKVIVCPGFLFQEPVQIAMETYPDVTFIAIDCTLENPAENAIGITYAEDQVGFLAGYAAVKDGMTNLGYMGGMAVPAVQKYGFGFLQGAEYAAQELGMEPGSITVKYHYTGGFDATPEAKALEKKALEFDLHLLQARCKHLGTEKNLVILQNIYEDLKKGMEFRFNTAVKTIDAADGGYRLGLEKGDEVCCDWLIAAPGRSGAEWFANECKRLGIALINNQVDIGVRVELPARVFEHITNVVYESKLVYRTKQYGDQVRTFCMNPYGHVVAENVEGINTVNGHSYSDPKLRSENTNFALLVSNRFTSPFNEPYRYGKHIASLSNMLAGGVLVYGIPEFRLPKAIVAKEVARLEHFGVKIMTDTVVGRTITVDELMDEMGFEAVFIGSGAGLPMFMNIPGVNYKGVLSANEFLTRINLMKAYLPDSDTPLIHPNEGGRRRRRQRGHRTPPRCAKRLGAEVYVRVPPRHGGAARPP